MNQLVVAAAECTGGKEWTGEILVRSPRAASIGSADLTVALADYPPHIRARIGILLITDAAFQFVLKRLGKSCGWSIASRVWEGRIVEVVVHRVAFSSPCSVYALSSFKVLRVVPTDSGHMIMTASECDALQKGGSPIL